jgi:hypothetical protein
MMKASLLACAAGALLAASAHAQVWNEAGDAGDMPGTAQTVAGAGALTDIFGAVSVTSDADIYRIRIANPAAFSATTNLLTGTMTDTTLYLFNLDGTGIAKNDDVSGSNFLSDLPAGNALYSSLAPGDYYLAVAGFAFAPFYVNPPSTIADLIFDVNNFTGVIGPQAGAAGMPILGWANAGMYDSGTYHVTLTGAEFVVPAPASLALLGLGGLVATRRRR